MSYYNMAGRRLWLPEPDLEPSEYSGPHYCHICERLLDADDPWPLCWVCARDKEE